MMSFGSNCCIAGYALKNVWNLFLFQKPMNAVALVVGSIASI